MKEELKKMKEEVENVVGKKKKNVQFKIENFNFYLIPLIVFIILVVIRPEFLYDLKKNEEKYFNFFKLITFTLLFSFMILLIINYENIYSLF